MMNNVIYSKQTNKAYYWNDISKFVEDMVFYINYYSIRLINFLMQIQNKMKHGLHKLESYKQD